MKKLPLVIFIFVLQSPFCSITAQSRITDLRVDHLETPMGIDNPNPRLSWKIRDADPGSMQNSYRILVGADSTDVAGGCGVVWDTGKTTGGDISVSYAGKPLQPLTRYYWKVVAGIEGKGESSSAVGSFETGMMHTAGWNGAWIGDGRNIDYEPAPMFRKRFSVDKTIRSARAYIAVAGLYELYINGEKIGDHRLDPMFTRFDRRNLYIAYDVTRQLQQGDNAIGVLLGNGWYNHQSKAVWDFDRAPWRNRPSFCMDLRITYTDGTIETVPTDLTWKSSTGGLVFNSIYTGEHYDARLEQDGWNDTGFDDSGWSGVRYRAVPSQNVTAQQCHPIRITKELPAVDFKKIDDKTYIFDFGQNISGVTRLNVSGEEGTVLRIKHGERLFGDGHIDMSNINVYYRGDTDKDPFQTDILILGGKGEDEFMCRFNYKGFRYAEVTADRPVELDRNSITACFMHSDVPSVGKIDSSSEMINKLWTATNNTYLSNLLGYPTDCPQREKNGWTGDAHFAIETALYNFDGITVYEKWLADHRDEQQPNGVLPDIIPTGGWGYGTENGLDWTSTIAIIPWNLYLFYGDSKPLADCYENIKRYVDYVDRMNPGHLTAWGRGDWVPVKSRSNKELTSSVYFYVDARILAQAARMFGKHDDHARYSLLAEQIKDAVNDKFLNRETGIYADGTQTELSVPLQWKIVPEDMIARVADNLAKKVEEAGFHLDVGVLGAKAVLNALSENGHFEAAYKVAVQDTYPSWGWWIVNGATTLWENWDPHSQYDISDNHMMFGEIGAWFFKGLGGIFPDERQPGFKHVVLRPNFTKELKYFEAEYESVCGTIVSKWMWKNSGIVYEIIIPANSSATLYLPANIKGEKVRTLSSGKHVLTLKPER